MKELVVKNVEGEYAVLSDGNGDELFIAMALLPENADIGTKLSYNGTEFDVLPRN